MARDGSCLMRRTRSSAGGGGGGGGGGDGPLHESRSTKGVYLMPPPARTSRTMPLQPLPALTKVAANGVAVCGGYHADFAIREYAVEIGHDPGPG